ncbi:MAG: 2-hydroxyacid dehydrogenase [Cytophagales bacterium]|nr:2-hydroxyacid dehydrogenase [Cytophagales bacterium]
MSTTKPEILAVMPLPPYARAQLDVHYTVHDRIHLSAPAAFAAVAPHIRAIVGSGEAKVPRELMVQMPNLKMVSVIGVGYDGVDTAAANELGIQVTHTPDVLNDDVADLALGLMLCAARKLPQADQYVRQGLWATQGAMPLARKVSGSRVGIVGMGRIGKTIAKRCAAFDMPISYTARSSKADLPFTFYANAKELAANVDFLVVITPGGAATKGLINAEVLAALGKGAGEGYLVNVARGTVIDQPALIDALQKGIIAGAGLDVFDGEPQVPDAFFSMANVTLAPHVGSATNATRKAMADLALLNLANFYAGKPLATPVPECR